MNVEAKLRQVAESGGLVIRTMRSGSRVVDLVQLMQDAIDEGRSCAFAPKKHTLRHFHTTVGFVEVMREVDVQLSGHRVIVEPGVYGSLHVFAVEPTAVTHRSA